MPTSVSELEAMYGVGNPLAYGQAQEQQGLSNIVQQQEAAQAQQKTQANSLANMFTEANNPNLLRKNAADAQGQEFKNMSEGVKGRNSLATEGLQLDDEKRKYLLNASDTDIKLFANRAQQMAYSDDKAVAAKGAKLLQLSAAAQQLRQNHEYEKEKQIIIRDSAERIAAGNNAVSRENSIRSATSSKYSVDGRERLAEQRRGVNATVESKIAAAKSAEHAINIYEAAAREAVIKNDPELAQYYGQMAQRTAQRSYDNKTAGVQAGQANKPNLGAMGVETNGMPVPPSIATPLPGMGAAAQPTAPVNNIPQGAIQMLRSNPKLAAQFEAKYGPGSSKQILGQ